MAADLIKSILSIVASLIPLIVTIIAILANRAVRAMPAIDSPALKIFSIKRQPLSSVDLRKVRKPYIITYNTLLLIISLFYVSIYIYININNIFSPSFSIIIVIIYSIIGVSIVKLLQRTQLSLFGRVSDQFLTYYLFDGIDVLIEADYHYAFNKCHETLRKMNFQVIEVNEGKGSLEATYLPPFFSVYSYYKLIVIQIIIDKSENSESSYKVKIEFAKDVSIPLKSKITNRFIDQLVSKPRGSEDKDRDVKNVSRGGEG